MKGTLTARDRVGWLLRSHRVMCTSQPLRSQAGVAAALSDVIGPVGTSTVSRWETGTKAATRGVLRGYEVVFELPPDSLTACVDVVRRYWSPSSSVRRRSELVPGGGRLDELLDAVTDDGLLTVIDWDQLTELVTVMPGLVLRARDWTAVADRLLRELLIADRGLYLRRREAFQRLLVHPVGQTAAIAAAVSAGADRTGVGIIEALSALDGSRHPDAGQAIVRQLEHPSTASAQVGALQAAVRKVRFGHFDPHQLATVRAITAELVRSSSDDEDVCALAGELNLSRSPVRDGPFEARRAVLHRLTLATLSDAPEALEDRVLPELIRELMFSPSADVRLLASSLVAASPFRATMAKAVTNELTSPRVVIDQVEWAEKLLDTLRLIGGQDQVDVVQRLTIAEGIPGPVGRAAAITLGHVGGTIDRSFWARAFGKYATLWRRHRTPAYADHLGGLVYSAGVLGENAILTVLHADTTLPAPARTAAAWWLNVPAYVSQGAQR